MTAEWMKEPHLFNTAANKPAGASGRYDPHHAGGPVLL